MNKPTEQPVTEHTKKEELTAFLFITVVLFPVLAVAVVGGLGFAIWISQMIFGPPGYPGS